MDNCARMEFHYLLLLPCVSNRDTQDVGDYRRKAELLEDDHGECNGQTVPNPNRLLKAGIRKGTNGVSTNGVTANFIF